MHRWVCWLFVLPKSKEEINSEASFIFISRLKLDCLWACLDIEIILNEIINFFAFEALH